MPTTLAPTAPPPPAAAPKGGAVKRVNLGGLTAKKPAAAKAKAYPVLPDDDDFQVANLARAVREEQEQFDAIEGSLKVNKGQLRTLALPFYFATNAGKMEVPSSVRCEVTEPIEEGSADRKTTGAVLVTFTSRYPAADEQAVIDIIGEDETARFFRQKLALAIDCDKIPAPAEGSELTLEALLGEMQELFEKYNATDALTVDQKIVPVDGFHTARHSAFTPEVNAALDLVIPCQVQVKSKNIPVTQ